MPRQQRHRAAWSRGGTLLLLASATLASIVVCSAAVKRVDLDFSAAARFDDLSRTATGRRRELRRLDADGEEALPSTSAVVHGNVASLGYYWAYVEIGTPPQKFSVILDTGSTITAVPCVGCKVCGDHMDPKFNPDESSTAAYVGCGDECTRSCKEGHCWMSQSYAEGSSLSGAFVKDKFWVGLNGEQLAIDFMFGCTSTETKLFKTQLADGIMGLAAQDNTIVSVLNEAHKLPEFVFTMCLGTDGGSMVVGGVNESQHTAETVYTPLLGDTAFYSVTFMDFKVDGTSLSVPSSTYSRGRTIVDSGTTFTYLQSPVYKAVNDALDAACANNACGNRKTVYRGEPDCFAFGNQDFTDAIKPLPSMTIVLTDMEIAVTPYQYLYPASDAGAGIYCVGMLDNGASEAVIGANIMRHYDVIFDRERERLGFAPAKCSPNANCVGCAANGPGKHPLDSLLGMVGVVAVPLVVVVLCVAVVLYKRKLKRQSGFSQLPHTTDPEEFVVSSELQMAPVADHGPPTFGAQPVAIDEIDDMDPVPTQ